MLVAVVFDHSCLSNARWSWLVVSTQLASTCTSLGLFQSQMNPLHFEIQSQMTPFTFKSQSQINPLHFQEPKPVEAFELRNRFAHLHVMLVHRQHSRTGHQAVAQLIPVGQGVGDTHSVVCDYFFDPLRILPSVTETQWLHWSFVSTD